MNLPGRGARGRCGRAANTVAAIPLAAVLAALAGCQIPTPGNDVTLAQTVLEMTDAVNALRYESSVMQEQIDSLRIVVARQDSAIARLSTAAGVAGVSP